MKSRLAAYLSPLLIFTAWLTLLVTALITRPLMPVDETRYVSVAWEMWVRGDFLVPYLNGEAYSHKPPLLFWLIQLGWWLFGVNDYWPRLVSPLVSLANIGLVAVLARRLWPAQALIAELAPWLLFGGLLWLGFYTLVQFDLLIVFCTLLGMLGMLRAARGLGTGWLLVGLAIGLGLLSKGPVILVHLLPVALLGRWWVERAPLKGWVCWYGGMLSALLLGALIGLAWALPAGQAGGEAYRNAIFWGQTAERMVESFAHQRPFYWYLPWLPVALLPWVMSLPMWQGLRALQLDQGVRLLLAWIVPVVLLLSLVSGKQVKYLLPIFPAFALLMAAAFAQEAQRWQPRRTWAVAWFTLVPTVLFLILALGGFAHRAEWVDHLNPAWGWAFGAWFGLCLLYRYRTVLGFVRSTALATVLVVIGLHISILYVAQPAYDLRVFSQKIARLQAAGHPIANLSKYHGQFHFLGRLQSPLIEVAGTEIMDWARAHPDGYVILHHSNWNGVSSDGADYVQDYRGEDADLALWSAAKLLAAQ